MNRRDWIAATTGFLATAAGPAFAQSGYPNKTIRLKDNETNLLAGLNNSNVLISGNTVVITLGNSSGGVGTPRYQYLSNGIGGKVGQFLWFHLVEFTAVDSTFTSKCFRLNRLQHFPERVNQVSVLLDRCGKLLLRVKQQIDIRCDRL